MKHFSIILEIEEITRRVMFFVEYRAAKARTADEDDAATYRRLSMATEDDRWIEECVCQNLSAVLVPLCGLMTDYDISPQRITVLLEVDDDFPDVQLHLLTHLCRMLLVEISCCRWLGLAGYDADSGEAANLLERIFHTVSGARSIKKRPLAPF